MVRVLPIHFGVVLGCKGGGGKKDTFLSRTVFSGAGTPNRAIGQIFRIKSYCEIVLDCATEIAKLFLVRIAQLFGRIAQLFLRN